MKIDKRWRKRADAATGKNWCCWCGAPNPAIVATGYCEHQSRRVRHVCCDQCMSKVISDPKLEAKFCPVATPDDVVGFEFVRIVRRKRLVRASL